MIQRVIEGDLSNENKRFAGAFPFPHLVIDDFLETEFALRLEKDFPEAESDHWTQFKEARLQLKLASSSSESLPLIHRDAIELLSSDRFIGFLEAICGIPKLIADPAHLSGAGLHRIENGGLLEMHVDFNQHPVKGWARRVNALLYLSSGWRKGYGGELELWSDASGENRIEIEPLFNRLVVFTTSINSIHGHPSPLTGPNGFSRKSIATYYYIEGSPDIAPHGTLWVDRDRGILCKRPRNWFNDPAMEWRL